VLVPLAGECSGWDGNVGCGDDGRGGAGEFGRDVGAREEETLAAVGGGVPSSCRLLFDLDSIPLMRWFAGILLGALAGIFSETTVTSIAVEAPGIFLSAESFSCRNFASAKSRSFASWFGSLMAVYSS
jgi:hypothetical protein